MHPPEQIRFTQDKYHSTFHRSQKSHHLGTPQDSTLLLWNPLPSITRIKGIFLPIQHFVTSKLSVRQLYKAQTRGKHNSTS